MSEGEAGPAAAPLDLTEDEILRGRLCLLQPRVGYRFSLDPLLLADFIGPPPYGRVIDLGAGCGIVGLALGRADPVAQVTLLELQPRLAQLCRDNARKNELLDRATIVEGDLLDRALHRQLPGASFDLVASCPPYYPLGRGDVNPIGEEAIARHELRLPLVALVRAARRLVGFRGRVALVYPSPRLGELLGELEAAGLRPVRLRLVYPRAGQAAKRAIVEARKGARGDLMIEPPFYVRDGEGNYTEEAKIALGEK